MMPGDDEVIGYAGAAEAYWQAGWRGILPLNRESKIGQPVVYCDRHRPKKSRAGTTTCPDCVHYTGYAAVDPSYADVLQWAETRPRDNLCLHLPDGIIGIDVDAYGAKTGAKALLEAIRRWGPLPATVRSTSRDDDPVSGIRLFRVPPGTLLEDVIAFPELGVGDIELIQFHHRYVVCWPSVHPEKRPYWWRNDSAQLVAIPNPGDLPPLPQSWIEGLRITPRSLLSGNAYDVKVALTAGEPSPVVSARFGQAVKELNLPGCSRHDTACRHILALLRMGKNGEPGIESTLVLLRKVFIAVTSVDRSRTPEVAADEFNRMVTSDGAARELAQPGINDWMRNLVGNPGAVPDIPDPGENLNTTAGAPVDSSTPKRPIEAIESGFWDSRESLQMIYTTALSKMCSPWAVLAQCAARALTQVRPHVTLPALIGGPGSLNWFAAVVARSGGGKGAAAACARLLVPAPIVVRNVGSGEGIVAAFGQPAPDGSMAEVRESVMFTADEVDTLAALNTRTASTTLAVLRSGFSGETLGFSYAAREKRRHIPAGTYRMTMVISVQPTRAGWLLADSGGGTPQRFQWFPGSDPRISRDRPWETGPLTLPAAVEWQYPREIFIPQEAGDLIINEHVKRQNDSEEALDGHALYCREKFAYALAVLDGRVTMTLEDWQLSGIAAAVSAYVREQTVEAIKEASRIDAIERGEIRGIELHSAEQARGAEEMNQVVRVVRWIVKKVDEAMPDGITIGALRKLANSRDYHRLDAALTGALSDGLVQQLDGTTTLVRL